MVQWEEVLGFNPWVPQSNRNSDSVPDSVLLSSDLHVLMVAHIHLHAG